MFNTLKRVDIFVHFLRQPLFWKAKLKTAATAAKQKKNYENEKFDDGSNYRRWSHHGIPIRDFRASRA
jgi:hypothetical protein